MNTRLSTKRIFYLWFPLAAMWLLMAVEGPLIQSVLSRMSDVKLNLAAFGVALSIAIFVEAPVFAIISAANTLIRDRLSYIRLKNFTGILSGTLTAALVAVSYPACYSLIARTFFALPEDVAEVSRVTILCFAPAPFFVAYRRVYQGMLIQAGRNHKVGQATIVRFIVLGTGIFALARFSPLTGAHAAALSLSSGFIAEALLIRWLARDLVREIMARESDYGPTLTYGEIAKFYLPLALSSLVFCAGQPVFIFFMARAPLAVESLATFPVIYNFGFLFGCLIFAMQEVLISRIGEGREDYAELKKFLVVLTLLVTLAQGLIVLTPLADLVFRRLYRLPEPLFALMIGPVMGIVLLQVHMGISVLQRSVLIESRRANPVTLSTVADVCAAAASMYLLVRFSEWPGLTCGVASLIIGRTASLFVLAPFHRSAYREKHRAWRDAACESDELALQQSVLS